jgi:hypothetical protein
VQEIAAAEQQMTAANAVAPTTTTADAPASGQIRPLARPQFRPAASDLIAALAAMSDEERIALFT